MLTYPNIDPVIFRIGPLKVRWYGLMYVIGFTASYFLVKKQIEETGNSALGRHFDNLNVVLILSLILGARLGYALFYNLAYYADHPLEILATWQGGMSFHGALIGLLVGGWIFCRRTGLGFLQTADIYIVTAPIGLGFGRLGNFINGELFGRVSDLPWAMVFPAGGPLPRHPSQLYECLLEGVLLFLLLWPQRKKKWPPGTLLAEFLIGYGLCRILVEFFRQPDPQLGFIVSWLTMGQLLSSVMVLTGLVSLVILAKRKPDQTSLKR